MINYVTIKFTGALVALYQNVWLSLAKKEANSFQLLYIYIYIYIYIYYLAIVAFFSRNFDKYIESMMNFLFPRETFHYLKLWSL